MRVRLELHRIGVAATRRASRTARGSRPGLRNIARGVRLAGSRRAVPRAALERSSMDGERGACPGGRKMASSVMELAPLRALLGNLRWPAAAPAAGRAAAPATVAAHAP